MKKVLVLLAVLPFFAQAQNLTTTPNGGNKKAWVGERVGLTDIQIEYNRPGVKGRAGKVWGELVHNGFADLQFGTSRSAPWRAGANENTTISFSTAVKIEGKDLPAGKYGFFVAYGANTCTLIFSKSTGAWGSFYYDEKDDALRVTVTPVKQTSSTEWLKYEFTSQTESGATIALTWENLSIPFKVETDLVQNQLAIFRRELTSEKSFNPGWINWAQAAQYCLQHNTNLEEGLKWAETASGATFPGEANFTTLTIKAGILKALGRTAEAEQAMKAALPLGTLVEVHTYGRQLLSQKKVDEAYAAFKMNYDKNPNHYMTNAGMARVLSAQGKYAEALEYASKALSLNTDAANKKNLEDMVKKLKEGKDVN